MKILSFLLTASLFLLSHCGENDLDRILLPGKGKIPEIIASYPADGSFGVTQNGSYWILFSVPMDHARVQSAFHLSGSEGRIYGSFRWEGNKMLFSPSYHLKKPDLYSIAVSAAAESEEGINLKENFTIRFYTVNDITGPKLISSSPSHNQTGILPDQEIRLVFSEALDPASIYDGIKITPQFLYTYTLPSPGTVIIKPVNFLDYGQYTLRIQSALKDTSGNGADDNRIISFTVGNDFYPPFPETVRSGSINLHEGRITSGCSRVSPLFIQFTEAMDFASVEKSISISPHAPYQAVWTADNLLQLNFIPPLQPETHYSVTLNSGAMDASMNALLHSYSYGFLTDAPDSISPFVVNVMQSQSSSPAAFDSCGGISPSGGFTAQSPLQDFSTISLSQFFDIDPSPSQNCVLEFSLQFNNSMIRNSFLPPNTSFESIMDPYSNKFTVQDIVVSEDGKTVRIQFLAAVISGGINETLLHRLIVRGGTNGVRDVNNNAMSGDYSLIFTF